MPFKKKKEKVHVSFSKFNEKLFSSASTDRVGAVSHSGSLHGRFSRTMAKISRCFSYTSTRSYGAFMLSFGFLTVILHLLKYLFIEESATDLVSLIIGVIFSAVSIPLLLSDSPMCIALQDNPVTDFILFEFFAIKRMHRINNNKTVPTPIALFAGFIPAGITFVIKTEEVALLIIGISIVALAFVSPEFPMLLSLVALPYIPLIPYYETFLAIVSVISFLSFAIKVFVGKRVYNFEIYDVLVFVFMALLIVFGFVNGIGAEKQVLIFVALTLSYFPASNLVSNRRLADLAVNAIVVSAVPVSIYSIAEFFMKSRIELSYSIRAFFNETTSLAAFLTVSVIFTLGFVIQKKATWKKLVYLIALLLQLFAVGLTVHPGLPLLMSGAFLGYVIVNMRKAPCDVASFVLIAVYALLSIFPKYAEQMLRQVGFSHNITLSFADSSFDFATKHIIFGAGIEEGFEIGKFNLLTGLISAFGVISFAIFVVMMIIRVRHTSYYRLYVRDSSLTVDSNMSFIALFSLLMLGAVSNMLADPEIYYLFFALFGIGSASLRSAKKEHEDRLGYYGDLRSAESSAIDVLLR